MVRSKYHAKRSRSGSPDKMSMIEHERNRREYGIWEQIHLKPRNEMTPYEQDVFDRVEARRNKAIKEYAEKQAKETFKLTGKLK